MPTDPITQPATTDGVGTLGMSRVYTGLRRRKWWHVFAVTADYTVDEDSEFLSVDGTVTGGVTISLEAAADVAGKGLIVYSEVLNTGETITVSPPTGDTVDGSSSLTITAQGKFVHLISDGASNWILYIDGR